MGFFFNCLLSYFNTPLTHTQTPNSDTEEVDIPTADDGPSTASGSGVVEGFTREQARALLRETGGWSDSQELEAFMCI